MWAFDRLRVTEEDRARPAMYAQELARQRAGKQASGLEEFLRSLQIEVRIAPMSPKDLARVAQLTQRTNQMNFTTVRRSESDIQALLESGKAECLTVHVSDRFGSYGLAGAMVFRSGVDALAIDTFLLSCRALGRGVEHRMLAAIGTNRAAARAGGGGGALRAQPRGTGRLCCFWRAPGLQFQSVRGETLVFRFPAEFAARIVYQPSAAAPHLAHAAPAAPAPCCAAMEFLTRASPPNCARWSRSSTSCAAEAPRGLKRRQPRPRGHRASDLERQLCRIWSGMLGVQADRHPRQLLRSWAATLCWPCSCSRALKEELGIELSLEVVYGADFTVAELAKAIELREIEMAGADRYAALLAEVESLTDEEVRELLAKESGEAPY